MVKRKGSNKQNRKAPGSNADTATTPASVDNIIRPQMAVRMEFGRRLEAALMERGKRQIDLANATDIGRDSISGYTRGRVLPDAGRLKKICEFLDMKPEDLVPHYGFNQKQVDLMPSFSFQASAEGDGWLRVNKIVTIDQMAQIAEILRKK